MAWHGGCDARDGGAEEKRGLRSVFRANRNHLKGFLGGQEQIGIQDREDISHEAVISQMEDRVRLKAIHVGVKNIGFVSCFLAECALEGTVFADI